MELLRISVNYLWKHQVRKAYSWLADRAGVSRVGRGMVWQRHKALLRRIRVGWQRWLNLVIVRVSVQADLRRAGAYMCEASLFARFRQFDEYATMIAKGRYSLVRLVKRRVVLGWNKLRENSELDHGIRAARHLGNQSLSRCWRRWVVNASRRSTTKRLVLKGASFMVNRQLARGLGRWYACRAARSEKRRLMLKGLSYIRHRESAGALMKWHATVSGGVETLLLGRSLAHFRNHGLSKGFRMLGILAKEVRSAAPCARALLHFLSRGLWRGWGAWLVCLEAAQWKRDTRRRSLSHMINHELSRGWKAWAEEVQAKLAAVLLLRKGLRFLLNREQARGVACWLRHVNTDEKQITAKANKDFLRSRFLRWRRGDGKHDRAGRAIMHALHQDLVRGWNRWRARGVNSEMLAAKAAAFSVSRSTVRGFHAWLRQKQEEDTAMQLTFASAAAILPLAAVEPTGASLMLADYVTEGELTPGRNGEKKAKASRALSRSPARPRMVFH